MRGYVMRGYVMRGCALGAKRVCDERVCVAPVGVSNAKSSTVRYNLRNPFTACATDNMSHS